MYCYYWVVEITRSHLQSLVQVLFDAFYSVLVGARDYALHMQDGLVYTPFDTHALDDDLASVVVHQDAFCDRIFFYDTAPFSKISFVLVDILFQSNNSVPSVGDYVA